MSLQSNESNPIIQFMESLIEDMGDMTWNVVSIEEYKEVKSEDGTVYAELSDGSRFEKQENIYIHQMQGFFEDDYSGTVIKPVTDTMAVIVSYHS
ncbi:hypothetical protein Goe2_c19600 [Bacillus phage vB_BsuM-Goe2]|uniref:Uncharacterized protein n=1 Tax=Bacillus phage vB_BsuM-Goe2 TaxID=1933062 RepID=A0A217EQU7_9CAUD|nr:hypothetical protein Goe2_c19600 [Bacillus phage vB_BsuM-Goe2]